MIVTKHKISIVSNADKKQWIRTQKQCPRLCIICSKAYFTVQNGDFKGLQVILWWVRNAANLDCFENEIRSLFSNALDWARYSY